MTAALMALRANFQCESDVDIGQVDTVERREQQRRRRIIEEPHPELLLSRKEKNQEKRRYKAPSLPVTIEEAREDDEEQSATTSGSSSPAKNDLKGRSPHVLPPEERFWSCPQRPANHAFLSHPLISPKLGRRCFPATFTTHASVAGATPNLQREFSDPVVRRKRSLSSLSERLSSGKFDLLPCDFLDLPPIPETGTLRKLSVGQVPEAVKEEVKEEDEEEEVCERVFSDSASKCSDSSALT